MTLALIRYDEACRAVAEARSIDEVKDIRDKAEAIRLYARQAKDRDLQVNVAEIRFRAERRIGELKLELRAAGKLHEGGRPKKTSDTMQEVSEKVRLSDLDVDDRLSVRCERLAAFEPNAFDRLLARWRVRQEEEAERPVSVNILKEIDDEQRREERTKRVYEGGAVDDLRTLIAAGRKFGAILADPPWHFVSRSDKGDGRSAGQHYKTEHLEPLKKLPIADLASDDCVLFVWMVDWCPRWALDLIDAWGFTHKTTAFTWVKENARKSETEHPGFFMGQGYWTRANPESCWLATRGHPKRVNADVRQLIVSPVMEHSRKPETIHDYIERLVDGPYLELFARRDRDRWQTWGNELAFKLLEVPHDPETGEIIDESAAPPIVEHDEWAELASSYREQIAAIQDSPAPAERPVDAPPAANGGGDHDLAPTEIAARKGRAADVGGGGLVDRPTAPASADLTIPSFLDRSSSDCIVKVRP